MPGKWGDVWGDEWSEAEAQEPEPTGQTKAAGSARTALARQLFLHPALRQHRGPVAFTGLLGRRPITSAVPECLSLVSATDVLDTV